MCADRNNQLTYSLIPRKDGTSIMMGGNQMLATPCKRLGNDISPSGAFKNDTRLGAPAFDGSTSGEPQVYEQIRPIAPARAVPTPDVTETTRLLATRDVNIGEGTRANSFTDGIDVLNVWYTLWKTTPATGYHVTRRNTYFQLDPESPLAVFLWQMDITLQQAVPNKGFNIISLAPDESKLGCCTTAITRPMPATGKRRNTGRAHLDRALQPECLCLLYRLAPRAIPRSIR